MTAHTPTPMTADELRILRAKHARRVMESGDTVNALLDHIDWLAAHFSREENEHAELQSRCFEGFPSISEGIFDAFKECRNSHDALVAIVERFVGACGRCNGLGKHRTYRKLGDETPEVIDCLDCADDRAALKSARNYGPQS